MSKKSRERKQLKLDRRGLPGIAGASTATSTVRPGVGFPREPILADWTNGAGEWPVRVVQESRILRSEPEFCDLYFDSDRVNEIGEHLFTQYAERVRQVREKSVAEREEFYSRVRTDIIEELITPEFRRDVLRRIEMLARRLAGGSKTYELARVTALQAMLVEKDLVWGEVGLIIAIYQASAERSQRRLVSDLTEFKKMLKVAARDGKHEELLTRPDESPVVQQMVERMQATPGLLKHLQRQTERAAQAFERAIVNGEVLLELFSEEEIQRPMATLEHHLASNGIDPATLDSDQMRTQFTAYIRATIGEAMTPDRVQATKDDLKRLAKEWLSEGNRAATALLAEANWLDIMRPAENPFLLAVYSAQFKRWRQVYLSADVAPEDSLGGSEVDGP